MNFWCNYLAQIKKKYLYILVRYFVLSEASMEKTSMEKVNMISMAKHKTAVTPLLKHWSYCSLVLSHPYQWLSGCISNSNTRNTYDSYWATDMLHYYKCTWASCTNRHPLLWPCCVALDNCHISSDTGKQLKPTNCSKAIRSPTGTNIITMEFYSLENNNSIDIWHVIIAVNVIISNWFEYISLSLS